MPKGRPRVRWEDNVRNDLRKMGVANWKQRMQERKQWKEIIEQAKTHRVVELKEEGFSHAAYSPILKMEAGSCGQ